MSRTIPSGTLAEMLAAQSGDEPVVLLTLQHPDIPGVTRIATAGTRTSDSPLVYQFVSNSLTYTFVPLAIQLPDDIDERAPTARLVLENVSRDLITFVRSVTTPGTCQIVLVDPDAPNTAIVDYPSFDIVSAHYDANVVTIELGLDALNTIAYPAGIMSPSGFPGIFS